MSVEKESSESKIADLLRVIQSSFSGVKLGNGISWREAYAIESHGSREEKSIARNKDEQNDWNKIPFVLIGDIKYQSVLSFLDAAGLKFYLPACMIYTLKKYKESQSLIPSSLVYTLTHKADALQLQSILSHDQKLCVIRFLSLCLEIGDNYFDLHKVEKRMQEYWIDVK